MERYKLKAECLFLICLGLFFALNCSFWYVLRFLILNLLRLQDAWTAYDRRTETKEERKRTRTTKRYTSNSLKLVEEVTPQIFFLDTKRFVISTDRSTIDDLGQSSTFREVKPFIKFCFVLLRTYSPRRQKFFNHNRSAARIVSVGSFKVHLRWL